MAKTSANTWLTIRKEFYYQIVNQVQRRLGKPSPDIRLYQKGYKQEFRKRWRVSSREVLLQKLEKSRVIYLGDFHPLDQSQRSHLRILKNLKLDQPLVLGLECFWSKDQKIIEAFMRGKLSESQFLKKIKWDQFWGFKWENYRPIMSWAKENKVPLVGLNGPSKKKLGDSLVTRDQWAADLIVRQLKKSEHAKMVVIYGDHHLAGQHIPQLVRKKMSLPELRIYQNDENIYFRLLQRKNSGHVDVISLGPESFCLMSVPPWVKWQNYLLFLEETEDESLNEGLDITDYVVKYIELIAMELQFSIKTDSISIMTAENKNLWGLLSRKFSLSHLKEIELFIEEEVPFFLPELGIGYLSRMSVNHAAGLAFLYIYFQVSKSEKSVKNLGKNMEKLIWLEALSYFGSKLINPKRKTETLLDIRQILSSKTPRDEGREALRLALNQKFNELRQGASGAKSVKRIKPTRISNVILAAHLLGGILGEKLYLGYRGHLISIDEIKKYLKINLSDPEFVKNYLKIVRRLESLSLALPGKNERF